jgi:hypothetical protein
VRVHTRTPHRARDRELRGGGAGEREEREEREEKEERRMREKFKPDTETGVRRGRTKPHHIPILAHVLGNSASRGPRNNLPQVHFAHKALANKSANLLAEILQVRGLCMYV